MHMFMMFATVACCCVAVRCSRLQWVAVGCRGVQVYCSVLQRVAAWCSVLPCAVCGMLKCAGVVCCSVLQCVAVCSSECHELRIELTTRWKQHIRTSRTLTNTLSLSLSHELIIGLTTEWRQHISISPTITHTFSHTHTHELITGRAFIQWEVLFWVGEMTRHLNLRHLNVLGCVVHMWDDKTSQCIGMSCTYVRWQDISTQDISIKDIAIQHIPIQGGQESLHVLSNRSLSTKEPCN